MTEWHVDTFGIFDSSKVEKYFIRKSPWMIDDWPVSIMTTDQLQLCVDNIWFWTIYLHFLSQCPQGAIVFKHQANGQYVPESVKLWISGNYKMCRII